MSALQTPRVSLAGSLGGAAVFLVATLAVIWAYLTIFAPEPYVPTPPPVTDYDRAAMLAQVTPDAVEAELATIRGFGSRFMGQAGFYATADYIAQRYRDAGLELLVHDVESLAPTVERSVLTDAAGHELPVLVTPFLPNHLQPVATPPEGVRGELVLVTEELLASGTSFQGKIAVIDGSMRAIDRYGWNWTAYAREGFAAVILTHEFGLQELAWGSATQMVASAPANYPRLAADPGILAHLGDEVVLHVSSRYTRIPQRTLVGRLKAGRSQDQAVVVPISYDAASMLPAVAPGGLQALSPALQLKLLDGLLPYRDDLRRDVIFVAVGSRTMANDGANRLAAALGRYHGGEERRRELESGLTSSQARLGEIETVLKAFAAADFCVDPERTKQVMTAWDVSTRTFFHGEYTFELNKLVQARSEAMLKARVAFEALGTNDATSPEFAAYMQRKNEYNPVFLLAGYPVDKIFRDKRVLAEQLDLRARFLAHFEAMQAFHVQRNTRLEQELALNALFGAYRELVIVSPNLATQKPPETHKVLFREPAAQQPEDAPAAGTIRLQARGDGTGALAVSIRGMAGDTNGEWQIPTRLLDLGRNSALRHLHEQGGEVVVELKKAPPVTPEKLSFYMGHNNVTHAGTQPGALKNLVDGSIQNLGLQGKVELPWYGVQQGSRTAADVQGFPFQAEVWSRLSYPAYNLVSPGGAYAEYAFPFDPAWAGELDGIDDSLKVTGDLMLMLAFGNGRFEEMPYVEGLHHLNGRVFASGVGQSILPNFALVGAVMGSKPTTVTNARGYFPMLLQMTDIYGNYDYPLCATRYVDGEIYSPDAAAYDATGAIVYMKDEGTGAQAVYKSVNVGSDRSSEVNIVTFRASAVSLLDLTNPQDLNPYSGVSLVRSVGMVPFESSNSFPEGDRIVTNFVAPAERFYVLLRAGSTGNERVQETRAFMLGTRLPDVIEAQAGEAADVRMGREIRGGGYLAAHTPYLLNVPLEVAKSMTDVNAARLAVQNRGDFRMADDRTVEFQEKGLDLLREIAAAESAPQHERLLAARDAVTYATLNHPILRENIFDAVLGIIWYLGLMVPFVFFFEKLVFGYTDIRKQLLAILVIFLAVFLTLKLLHPAFTMIRSSFMILLGFVIILISGGITVLFSSKFKENLEQIRKAEARVSTADVNRLGVIGTAFLLGLNNMHRRRVRTGLTCATLVLLTFVMICFTSVQSDLVDREVAIGKAPYQGFVIEEEMFRSVSGSAYNALDRKYGNRFAVVQREFYVGTQDWATQERRNPDFHVTYTPSEGAERAVTLASALHLDPEEPLAPKLTLLTSRGWFRPKPLHGQENRILLPAGAARELQITPAMVDSTEVTVQVGGASYVVQGIFEPASLENLLDLDSRTLLPLDVTALQTVQMEGRNIIGPEDSPRIAADQVLILPREAKITATNELSRRTYSVALVMPPDLPYRDARAIISNHLEQSGKSTYYGLDGYAFNGKRARESSLVGLVDMTIPLFIAVLTVMATMKGSVYERRDEIFVYNAVGIAPIYIGFMFLAEALVYAVVGSVLGFILSQGTGRMLTALDLTGGLNMTFTSFSTVAASWVIAAATIISSLLPARDAMRIAKQADEAGWQLPEPEADDLLTFRLPFTFTWRDRVAVLVFFQRFFHAHGEGSSGDFYAGRPSLGVATEGDILEPERPVPQIRVPIWLKPFDLGVSQTLDIRMVVDEETREYCAQILIMRNSGSRENWLRLNLQFVKLLRRHFLHWRAVTDDERAEMFDAARSLMTGPTALPVGTAHG